MIKIILSIVIAWLVIELIKRLPNYTTVAKRKAAAFIQHRRDKKRKKTWRGSHE